jgi:hypothetical protein
VFSLLSDTTGKFNTSVGAGTLLVIARLDTASGARALRNNTAGSDNCQHTNQTKR